MWNFTTGRNYKQATQKIHCEHRMIKMLLKNRINKTTVDISSILLQILEAGNVLMKVYSEMYT